VSPQYLHATAIIAEVTLSGESKFRELNRLVKRAKDLGCTALSENILLTLLRDEKKPEKRIKRLEGLLSGEPDVYNRARAIVMKAEAIQESKKSSMLNSADLRLLSNAYSYFHGQRFGSLFDRSHKVLWGIFEERGETDQLLRLFRHTSFLWRIRGEESKEAEYVKRLKDGGLGTETTEPTGKGLLGEVTYFLRRLKAIFTD